jgi:hypothetical protein
MKNTFFYLARKIKDLTTKFELNLTVPLSIFFFYETINGNKYTQGIVSAKPL